MNFQPRQYTLDAIDALTNGLKEEKEFLLQAIMGAGKTVITCKVIEKYFFESHIRFLILCHKPNLIEQFQKTFREKTAIPQHEIGISCASLDSKVINKRITIGSVQTFVNKIKCYQECDLLVIDEAHRIEIGKGSRYDKVINILRYKNPDMRIVGITATPYRLGHGYIYGNRCVGKNLFPNLNHRITYEELKSQCYLMPLEGKIAVNSSLSKDMKSVETSGDYILNQLSDVMVKEIHLQTAVDGIKQYCNGFKHICVFCCSIDHAEKLKNLIGDRCTTVHSELSKKEQKFNLDNWKRGITPIITSINILAEGFDFPPLDCLVNARPTLSSALWLQMIGRVLRISEGKDRAFLLDLTGNTEYFGTDLDNIRVNIPKQIEEKEKKEHQFEKECPECHTFVHVARFDCPNCGHEYPAREQIEATAIPELKDIKFSEPEEHTVHEVVFFRHQKEGKPDSVRVEFHNENYPYRSKIASDWLCFDHDKAKKFAEEKWKLLTGYDVYPESTDEALAWLKEDPTILKKPTSILVKKQDRFNKIVDYRFDKPIQPISTIAELSRHVDYDDDIPF